MTYGDIEKVRAAERKEVKRAVAPELRAKLPARKNLGKGKYGIRYSYRSVGSGHVFTRWYEKEAGRDQAFRVMSRVHKLPDGREYRVYKLLEKIDRIGHGNQ